MVTIRNMGDRHHHEDFHNNREDPIPMMLELRKEMETLKRKNADELEALRECEIEVEN